MIGIPTLACYGLVGHKPANIGLSYYASQRPAAGDTYRYVPLKTSGAFASAIENVIGKAMANTARIANSFI